MTRSEYAAYQKDLVRLLNSDRKVRSDKGAKRTLRRTVRKVKVQ
jgi:hypothetical protein